MNITKKELILKSRYNWSESYTDQLGTKFFGDHLIFGRHDGMQVLFLINKLMGQHGLRYQLPLKIEEMLIFLPEKQFTHIQVKAWLMRNWDERMVLRH